MTSARSKSRSMFAWLVDRDPQRFSRGTVLCSRLLFGRTGTCWVNPCADHPHEDTDGVEIFPVACPRSAAAWAQIPQITPGLRPSSKWLRKRVKRLSRLVFRSGAHVVFRCLFVARQCLQINLQKLVVDKAYQGREISRRLTLRYSFALCPEEPLLLRGWRGLPVYTSSTLLLSSSVIRFSRRQKSKRRAHPTAPTPLPSRQRSLSDYKYQQRRPCGR